MKNFKLKIILRAALLTINLFICCFMFFHNYVFVSVGLAALTCYQVWLLIKFVERTNRDLASFLRFINYSDFTYNINYDDFGDSFSELSDEFNKILNKFKQARSEKEETLKYLETVIQHVGVGLISFDSKGDIGFVNRAARQLLNLHGIKNISSLDNISPDFSSFIYKLIPGQKAIYKITGSDEIIHLLLYAADFRMKNQLHKLVALQNIYPELEEKEIEAWQRLIRVLTHEIMNSITPISSLASTVNKLLMANSGASASYDAETVDDIKSAVSAIQKRSEGLITFVDKYRSLTKIPKPDFKIFKVIQIVERIKTLFDSALPEHNIKFIAEVNPVYLELTGDSDLIEQVLINLLNNAVQSIAGAGMKEGIVSLIAQIDNRGRAIIKITDNGPGIAEGIIDKIFIPFFSAKKEGSGIGLSLSKQIMRAHGGTIGVRSIPGKETVFTLRF